MVKNSPASSRNTRDMGLMPGLGRFPGGGILAWEIPRTEEPGGLQSMGPQSWL